MTDHDTRRDEAIERLERRRELMVHVGVYCAVNLLLVVIWAASGARYFWPIWPIAGWGFGLAMHALQLRQPRGFSEADIREEMRREEHERRVP